MAPICLSAGISGYSTSSATGASATNFGGMNKAVIDDGASNMGLIILILLTVAGVVVIAIGIHKAFIAEKDQQENNQISGGKLIAGGSMWIALMVVIGWVTGVSLSFS